MAEKSNLCCVDDLLNLYAVFRNSFQHNLNLSQANLGNFNYKIIIIFGNEETREQTIITQWRLNDQVTTQ